MHSTSSNASRKCFSPAVLSHQGKVPVDMAPQPKQTPPNDPFACCRTTSDDQELVAQPTEVDAVRWMPMDDYVNSPLAKSSPLYGRMVEQCRAWAHGERLFCIVSARLCKGGSSALLLTMPTPTAGAATLSSTLWFSVLCTVSGQSHCPAQCIVVKCQSLAQDELPCVSLLRSTAHVHCH